MGGRRERIARAASRLVAAIAAGEGGGGAGGGREACGKRDWRSRVRAGGRREGDRCVVRVWWRYLLQKGRFRQCCMRNALCACESC